MDSGCGSVEIVGNLMQCLLHCEQSRTRCLTRERVYQIGRDNPNLPQGSRQQYESLTNEPNNDLISNSYLDLIQEDMSIWFKFQEQVLIINSPFGEADVIHRMARKTKRSMRTISLILISTLQELLANEVLNSLQ